MKQKAIFWDRDGVINEVIERGGGSYSPRAFDEFKLVEGIREVLKKVKDFGFLNIIMTNQPDISRGLMQKVELDKMHDFLKKNLPIDDIIVCMHDDNHNCNCRKPKPGMILTAAKQWSIDLTKSFVVGDAHKDIEAGRNAGCKTIFIKQLYNQDIRSDFVVESLDDIVNVFEIKTV